MAGRSESASADEDARSIVTTRLIDAPRELVFEAFTDPRRLAEWWGPNGFTTTTSFFDMRPGGVWRFVMHGPDGTDYENRIRYQEVVKPERIAFKHDSGEDSDEATAFHTTVTFEDVGGKTRLTLRAVFPSKQARDTVAREHNAIEGGKQTVGRLADYVGGLGETKREETLKTVVLVRTFDAPLALVWKAWTDEQQMSAWWGPHGFAAPVVKLDVRPGGKLRIDMQAPDGSINSVTGEFHEVVKHKRLSFTSEAFNDESGAPQLKGFNDVTFVEWNGRTTMIVEASILKAAPWLAMAMEGMSEGWSQSFEKLKTLLTAP